MGKRRNLVFAALAVLLWAFATASILGYYHLRLQEYESLFHEYEAVTARVNIAINYGNGTMEWYNNTIVPLGANLLNATKRVVDVQEIYDSEFGASLVNSINGVANNQTHFWMWKYWDPEAKQLKYGEVGPDLYRLRPNETVFWLYETFQG